MKSRDQSAQTIALFCRLYLHAKRDLPLRTSEMGLLIFLVRSEAEVTPLMAASFLKVSKPRITQALNQLEAMGYIEKQPSIKDKRSFVIRPTEVAITLVESTEYRYLESLTRLEQQMGQEAFHEMVSLLDKANQYLREDSDNE